MAKENWYYYSNDQAQGPVSFEVLKELAGAGIIGYTTQIVKEGDQEWSIYGEVEARRKSAPPATESKSWHSFSNLADKVSQATGLEKLDKQFTFSHFFSEVFKKHTAEEMEEHFNVGTKETTPDIRKVTATWPSPWAFFRFIGITLLLTGLFYWALIRFDNHRLLPGWLFVGCFGIPFSILIFFFEVNILKNLSFYRILFSLFWGGLLSLILSLFLFEKTGLDAWMGAMAAGIIEETGKLLAVVYLAKKWQKDWILNGMLLGAAVGTGFAAFETAGYVFEQLFSDQLFASEGVMLLRGFFSPFTHTIWTAATAAALWRLKGNQPFNVSMLLDMHFLRIFIPIVLLHTLWNSPLFTGATVEFFASRIGLGIIGWTIVFLLIQSGINQVAEAQKNIKT